MQKQFGEQENEEVDSSSGFFHFQRLINTGVGVEVEVERVPGGYECPAGWLATDDASLRNHGMEFITVFGSRLRDIPKLLKDLFESFREYGNQGGLFEFSERTSIHIHLDARNLSAKELKTVMLLYTMFEDALYGFAGNVRRHNVFCVPLRYLAISDLRQDNFVRFVEQWGKYCAFNLTRLRDYGTIEFRHMEGTADEARICTWIFILSTMMDYARKHSCESVMEEIKKLKYASHYHDFVGRVLGPLTKYIDINPIEFDSAVSDAKLLFQLRT